MVEALAAAQFPHSALDCTVSHCYNAFCCDNACNLHPERLHAGKILLAYMSSSDLDHDQQACDNHSGHLSDRDVKDQGAAVDDHADNS